MCGLVGLLTATPAAERLKNEKFFTQGLFTDSLRGMDATGIFTVDPKTSTVETCKKAMPSPDFLQLRYAAQTINRALDNGILVGHNRAKTFGPNTNANAHPHAHGPITLVHNGSLTNHQKLVKNWIEVDTVALTEYIATHTIQDVINNVKGAYTLIWHDARDKSINFLSNGQREFAMAQAKNKKGWYFASESRMLEWLLHRTRIDIEGEIEEAPHNTHIRWDMEDFSKKPVIKKYFPIVVALPRATSNNRVFNQHSNQNNKERGSLDLPALGVRFNQKVECWGIGFTKYAHSEHYGEVEGYMMDKPHMDVVINGVKVEDWENHKDDVGFSGVIKGAHMEHGVPVLRLGEYRNLKEETPEKKSKGAASPSPTNDREAGADDTVLFLGPTDMLLTKVEWDRLTRYGCDHCGGNIEDSDHHTVAWTNAHKPICASCADEMVAWGVLNPSYFHRKATRH